MPWLIVPFDATSYGLPADVDAWKLELDRDDVTALAGPGWTDLRLIVVGERSQGLDERLVEDATARVLFDGGVPVDIIFVEASLNDRRGVLQWSWTEDDGERLDLQHVEYMSDGDVNRLLRARNVIDLARSRMGRRPGSSDWPPEKFVPRLAEVVRALRRNRARGFTQRAVATAFPTNVTTLRSNMKRDGIEWSAIKVGDWPPR